VAEGPEYTFGRKTTTRRLTVQNLSKVEDSLMDSLSSQDFDNVSFWFLFGTSLVSDIWNPCVGPISLLPVKTGIQDWF
jgi:hypothetical protein